MEIKEAIEQLEDMISEDCTNNQWDYIEEIDMAISALKKQVGKKPDYQYETTKKHMDKGVKAPFCPVCGADLLDDVNDCFEYCPECGQKIDWEVKE